MTSRTIRSPTGKTRILAPTRPNAGTEALYRRKLVALIDEMQASVMYWIKAAYRAHKPLMAQDKSPALELQASVKQLSKRWMKRVDEAAPNLAGWFATSAAERSDVALKAILHKGGMTVKFELTPSARDVLNATIGENVALIKSIASEHFSEIEGAVMRSVSAGRDLHSLAKTLEDQFGVTKKRAAFIARDQNNKATATITRVRQQELGVTEAIWMHSGGGRVPRPSHVKAGRDKLRYDVAKGAYIDGAWIRPGELPNCRCVSRSVIPGF